MGTTRMARTRSGNREQEDGAQGNLAAELTIEFCSRVVPNLALSRWLLTQGVDVGHVFNVAGPIAEHSVTIHRSSFELVEDGARGAVRAVVHIARGDDAEAPVDLIAWTREQPERVFQSLDAVEEIGVDQIGNPASWFLGKPLAVHRRPLDWLRAGCIGIMIFDAGRG